jgi:hypothetical protein
MPSQEAVNAVLLEKIAQEEGLSFDTIAEELSEIETELQRRRWRTDPVAWATERLGEVLWSGQERILRSISDHRRTCVQSCHEIGKSYIAARVVAWWLDIWPVGESFVVTSAPTDSQVRTILWREIGRAHAGGALRGRVNQTEWYMKGAAGNEEIVAFGRKPADYEPTSFQGIHARRVLVIFDEACGMPEPLWEAADSLIANDLSKMLIIGNPDDPLTHFESVSRPGSGWNNVTIGAFDSPNFTGEEMPQKIKDQLIGPMYVEEKRRKWAPTWTWNAEHNRVLPPDNGLRPEDTCAPLWMSKILGLFPPNSTEMGLIPASWVREAQERTLPQTGLCELGVDVGGGGDSSTIGLRYGGFFRVINEDHNPDTMHTCGLVITKLRETRAERAKIDTIGIGKGVVDRGLELQQPFVPVNVGEKADNEEEFINRRAELWWYTREQFEAGNIDLDPLDDDLAAELTSIRFLRTSSGKVQIESKQQAKARGIPSPNRAEALMLAFGPERAPLSDGIATWR